MAKYRIEQISKDKFIPQVKIGTFPFSYWKDLPSRQTLFDARLLIEQFISMEKEVKKYPIYHKVNRDINQ